jgi:hypothetical protein
MMVIVVSQQALYVGPLYMPHLAILQFVQKQFATDASVWFNTCSVP